MQQVFRPVEADIDVSRIQFSNYSDQGLQVADYSKVEYLQQSDSEQEDFDEMEYTYGEGESLANATRAFDDSTDTNFCC